MTTLNRVVEMYVGKGTEFGTWSTEYVEIPRDTPDNEIELKAINQAKEDFRYNFVFVGVYSIPSLEDSDEIMEYDLEL